MPRNVFISFLGTTDYKACNYFDQSGNVQNVRFVQEAVLQLHCKHWTPDDVIVILLTDKARQQNWEDFTFVNKFTKAETPREGLQNRLKKLGLPCLVIDKDVKDGNNEDEIWENFTTIFDLLQQGDRLTIDITHAFRYFPVFAMVLANYAKFLKNITITRICYGNYEANDNTDKPIIDITSFAQLQDWTSAADAFVSFGNAQRLTSLIDKQDTQLATDIKRITQLFSTVRGKEIFHASEFHRMQQRIKTIPDSPKALQPLKNEIEKVVQPFAENDMINGFRAVKFCYEHSLIQQGITLLQETILSYLLHANHYDWKNKDLRTFLSACLQKERKDINPDKLPTVNNPDAFLNELYMFDYQTFSVIYKKLSGLRNDMNHAGYIEGATSIKKADTFEQQLKKLYNLTVEIVNGFERDALQPIGTQGDYWKVLVEKYNDINKTLEKKHGCNYWQRKEWLYAQPSHTWEHEEEILQWGNAITCLDDYTKKLEQWTLTNSEVK